MEFTIPTPLKSEHEELHMKLAQATRLKSGLGAAAKEVAKILHPHFVKEEEFALPPLGILPVLVGGVALSPELAEVLAMTDKLKKELPEMLREHKAIVAALKKFSDVAKKEKRPGYARFAEKLILHARTEEEVLYPSAILIGEYLKLKLGGTRRS